MRQAYIYILTTSYSLGIAKTEEWKTLKEGDQVTFGNQDFCISKINNDSIDFDGVPKNIEEKEVKHFNVKVGLGKYIDDDPNIICGYSHWLVVVNDIALDEDQDIESIKKFESALKSLPDTERKALYGHYYVGIEIPSFATDEKEMVFYDLRDKTWRAPNVEKVLHSALSKLEQEGYWPSKTIRMLSYLSKLYMYEDR